MCQRKWQRVGGHGLSGHYCFGPEMWVRGQVFCYRRSSEASGTLRNRWSPLTLPPSESRFVSYDFGFMSFVFNSTDCCLFSLWLVKSFCLPGILNLVVALRQSLWHQVCCSSASPFSSRYNNCAGRLMKPVCSCSEYMPIG